MVELKVALDDLEQLIESRANKKLVESYKVVSVNRERLIKRLIKARKSIIEKLDESKELWKQGVELYYDLMKKNLGSQSIQRPPNKPSLPAEYDNIEGYIDMFESIENEGLSLELIFLEKIFLEVARGLTTIRDTYNAMAFYCSGSAWSTSDYSLTLDRDTVDSTMIS